MSPPLAWVFDLDGTLAQAQHDFDGMKRALGLPEHLPLLEGVEALPEPQRTQAWVAVGDWEMAEAARAVPAPGVVELLDHVDRAGAVWGVLTRNRKDVAWRTLEVLRLDHRVRPEVILGRTCAPPKPHPGGILQLTRGWGVGLERTVMVGDSVHDVATARAAGVRGVLVHRSPDPQAAALADVIVESLADLCRPEVLAI